MKTNTVLLLAAAGVAAYLIYNQPGAAPPLTAAPYTEHPITDIIGDIVAPLHDIDSISLMIGGPLPPLQEPSGFSTYTTFGSRYGGWGGL